MKKIFFCVLMVTLMIILPGCNKKPVQIGFVATLSGGNSEIGISIRDGILLKIHEVNQSGGVNGHPVELIIRDDKGDLALIEQYNYELYDQGIRTFFGYELSNKFNSLETFLKEDVILISPTLSSHYASGIKDHFFRTIATNVDQGIELANYSNEHIQNKHTLILYDSKNQSFTDGVIQGFISTYNGTTTLLGLENDYYLQEDLILEKYKGHDSVLLVFGPNDCATIAQIFYKNNIKTQFYSSSWGMVSDGYLNAAKAMEGTIFTSHIGDETDTSYQAFIDKFTEKFNEPPQFSTIYAYEAATMYFTAIENNYDLSPEEIRSRMISLKPISGILSTINFDEYGDINRKCYVSILEDGILVFKE